MKTLFVLVALLVSANAYAYTSASGNDPNLGNYDRESKVAVKTEATSHSDALSVGHVVYYYESSLTGLYTVSLYHSENAGNTLAASKFIAGVVERAVATGDVAGFPITVRGYTTARYDATSPISKGGYLCVGTAASVRGKLIGCDANVTSPIVALEAKASGSGTDLKVRLNSN